MRYVAETNAALLARSALIRRQAYALRSALIAKKARIAAERIAMISIPSNVAREILPKPYAQSPRSAALSSAAAREVNAAEAPPVIIQHIRDAAERMYALRTWIAAVHYV